jgi:DNA-binding MarR family transcriptional regulator
MYYVGMKRTTSSANDWQKGHTGHEPHLMREIIKANQALMNIYSREVGMSSAPFSLLRLLAITYPDTPGTLDIARHLNINPAAVTRQLKQMESDGIITRISDPKDGRRSYVQLTEKGLRVFRKLHDRAHEFEQSLEKTISHKEMVVAAKVLARLRETLENIIRDKYDAGQ